MNIATKTPDRSVRFHTHPELKLASPVLRLSVLM